MTCLRGVLNPHELQRAYFYIEKVVVEPYFYFKSNEATECLSCDVSELGLDFLNLLRSDSFLILGFVSVMLSLFSSKIDWLTVSGAGNSKCSLRV